MPKIQYQWVSRDPTKSALGYQTWVRVRKPAQGNDLESMKWMLIVQQQKGTIDTAGGTPQDWGDYLTGPDGYGIPAEIQDPRPETAIMALAESITLTHTIRVRYDTRIKADMRAKWYFEGAWHYAKIHTVAPTTNNTWMMLDCKEHTTQAGAY